MVERCSGRNRDDSPCSAQARPGRRWCSWHDPDLAAQRTEWRRKGGAGKSNANRARKELGEATTLTGVQAALFRALGKVERGDLEPARATAMAALGRAIVAVAEAGAFEERIAAVEHGASGQRDIGGR